MIETKPSNFRLSTGAYAEPRELQEARDHVAKQYEHNAKLMEVGEWGFASHITAEQVKEFAAAERRNAKAVAAGERDHNFTIWQQINFHITGDCVALLP